MFRLSNEAPSDSADVAKSNGVVSCAEEDHGRPLAQNKEKVGVAIKIAAGLIAWIVAKTNWTACDTPVIQFVPPEELVKRYTAGKSVAPHIEALY